MIGARATRWVILVSIWSLAPPTVLLAEVYLVNPEGTGDFPTIQAAIDWASDGDVIELTDGIFRGDGNRDVEYFGRVITIRSQSGVAGACVIDCEGTRYCGSRNLICALNDWICADETPFSAASGAASQSGAANMAVSTTPGRSQARPPL